jgi:amino acid transporter
VDIPCAGGAYTYIAAALGEYLAWITVANLIFEYILANAAAVRGFSPYVSGLRLGGRARRVGAQRRRETRGGEGGHPATAPHNTHTPRRVPPLAA